MIIEIDNLISLANYAKAQKKSRQYINMIKKTLPIVLIDGTPYIDKAKLNIIDSNNINTHDKGIEVMEGDQINQYSKNDFLDY